MNDALAKRTDLVRAFIDERVHPAISGTENRDRFASLYRQRTRAKSWQLVNRANIKPFCGDRKSVVSGKSVSVRVDLGGRRIIKKKTQHQLSKNTKQTTRIIG